MGCSICDLPTFTQTSAQRQTGTEEKGSVGLFCYTLNEQQGKGCQIFLVVLEFWVRSSQTLNNINICMWLVLLCQYSHHIVGVGDHSIIISKTELRLFVAFLMDFPSK